MLRREEVFAGEAKAETSEAKGGRRRTGRGERPRPPHDHDDDGETPPDHQKDHHKEAEKAHHDGEGNSGISKVCSDE